MSDASTEAPRARAVEPPVSETADASGENARHSEGPSLRVQLRALYAAASGLVAAFQGVLASLLGLVRAEGRVLRAGVPLLVIGVVALISLAVSLWFCTVALIGWALMAATHSLGIALGLLVLGHIGLILAVWFALRRGVHQATFPAVRAELGALRGQFAAHVDDIVRGFSARAGGDRSKKDQAS